MATRTFTNGGVNDLASTAGNWDTAPADDDAIVIAAGSNCCWDVDTSAWANGVAGLTITSHATTPAMLYFKTSGTTNYLKIKTGTTINGTDAATKGRLLANADGVWANSVVYPAAAQATIAFVTTGYLDGTYLDVKILCAEPVTKKVLLASNASASQKNLVVDTDVSAQWASGQLISICDLTGGAEQETREIDSISGTTITVKTNLTAAKTAGTYPCEISLVNRNFEIICGAGVAQKCIANLAGTAQTVNAMVCPTAAGQGYAFDTCSNLTISGGFHGAGAVGDGLTGFLVACNSCNIALSGSTTQNGNSYCCYSCTVDMSGTVTQNGNTNACSTGTVVMSGSVSQNGNFNGCNQCIVDIHGAVKQNGNAFAVSNSSVNLSSCTIGGNTIGLSKCSGQLDNCSFANTTDISQCAWVTGFTNTFAGTTENSGYNTYAVPDNSYVMSKGHDGSAGAAKAWSPGGITISRTSSPPTGYTTWRQITCESATRKGFHQEPMTIMPGQTLSVEGVMRIGADHSSYAPKIQIVNQGATDPLFGGTALDTMDISDADGSETGWQAVDVLYKNTTALPMNVWVRVVGMRVSGTIDFAWSVDLDQPVVTDVRTGTSFNFGSTGTCNVPTAAQTLLGVAVDDTTGNVTEASEEDVRKDTTFGSELSKTGLMEVVDVQSVVTRTV
jgi:hypothetical protein